ncbi:MAG: ABC transporter ATP-binding protein [Clostridiales bacterium]|nr:ABC transporter ATP-binding protein [Clostridiales bacterium]
MSVISVNNITKDYGNSRGVFNISFTVEDGEVMGFLGPNGAGKTTTIRQLMGFIHPDSGSVSINGMDCFTKSHEIQKSLGYLPGEIALMNDMTGMEFIRFIAKMKGLASLERAKELMAYFELDPRVRIKKMSKGMKQKMGIVVAFMQDPAILILDEPSSGLDPLMQNKFIDMILREKKKGKTILMSSHIFEEVEKTCDRVAIIRQGYIVAVDNIARLQKSKRKIFTVELSDRASAAAFAEKTGGTPDGENRVACAVSSDIDSFIKTLAEYPVVDLTARSQTLEEFFLHFYGGEAK